MTEEEIIDYVMNTPGNSNPAVLGGMLSQYGGSGSGEVFWVTYTYDEDASSESGEDVYTCDHTFQEIQEAINSNKNVIAREDQEDGCLIIPLINTSDTALEYCLVRTGGTDTNYFIDSVYFIHEIEQEESGEIRENISHIGDSVSILRQ